MENKTKQSTNKTISNGTPIVQNTEKDDYKQKIKMPQNQQLKDGFASV